MTQSQPLTELVQALIASTRSGKTQWEPVDAQGNTYLASRRGGTVLLSGPTGASTAGMLLMGPQIKIEVMNSSGETLEKGDSSESISSMLGTPTVANLPELWQLVSDSRSQTAAKIRSLAKEFRS